MWFLNKVEISFSKIGFVDSKWATWNTTGFIHPLVLFAFGSNCMVPFPPHVGAGKCCMWLLKKLDFSFSKIGFVDSKWANWNTTGSSTPWFHSLLGPTVWCHCLMLPLMCLKSEHLPNPCQNHQRTAVGPFQGIVLFNDPAYGLIGIPVEPLDLMGGW